MDPDFIAIVRATASADTPTSIAADMVRLWHGTDMGTAMSIAQSGVSYEQMVLYLAKYGPGRIAPDFFWTTTRPKVACTYAYLNNAVNINGARPAVLSFVLPTVVVAGLLSNAPPLVEQWSPEDADYRFSPECFATINSAMADVMVDVAANVNLDE